MLNIGEPGNGPKVRVAEVSPLESRRAGERLTIGNNRNGATSRALIVGFDVFDLRVSFHMLSSNHLIKESNLSMGERVMTKKQPPRRAAVKITGTH